MLTPDEVLALVPGSALSHETAAAQHGLEQLRDADRLCLTVPRNRSRLVLQGWEVFRRDVPRVEVDGRQVTTLERTVVDLAGDRPLAHALPVADSAVRLMLVTHAALVLALTAKAGPNRPARRRVARLVDPLAGSVLESAFRLLVAAAGLPAPLSQYVVREAGRFVARVDFCWEAERVIVEVDGFAWHSDRASFRSDRYRHNDLERLGWRVLRFGYEDVMSEQAYVLRTLREVLGLAA